MSREAHVQFCESLGVRFLGATHPETDPLPRFLLNTPSDSLKQCASILNIRSRFRLRPRKWEELKRELRNGAENISQLTVVRQVSCCPNLARLQLTPPLPDISWAPAALCRPNENARNVQLILGHYTSTTTLSIRNRVHA